jgi:nitrate/TMAO reductase-like tetraheme cytochrome c subunit
MGKQCADCHHNIHKNYLDEKYIPGGNCKSCHSLATWYEVNFDHSITSFALLGQHAKTTCKSCHFREINGNKVQQFKDIGGNCEKCHVDIHFKQFEIQGINVCERCHTFNNWKPEKFNHNNARFKLDGKHEKVACIKCHKPNNDPGRSYVIYKFKDISCASCH